MNATLAPSVTVSVTSPGVARVALSGDLRRGSFNDPWPETLQQLQSLSTEQVQLDGSALTHWDASLLATLGTFLEMLSRSKIQADCSALPAGMQRLIQLSQTARNKIDAGPAPCKETWLVRLSNRGLSLLLGVQEWLSFIGEVSVSLGRLATRKSYFRMKDFWMILENCGARALPIVTLISFLVGVTTAFIGAIQLETLGASIYVANLVGLAMVREMGAIMVGIILCGRTGAAFASELGTMKVSEEIDALRTLGIRPMDFLVVPRLIALTLMTPLLCIYADFIGMLGGMFISVMMLDITPFQYVHQTQSAFQLLSFSTGVIKSFVFGILVVLAGCFQGMRCENSSAGVGLAVTKAVVMGITSIVIADSIFAVIFNALNI